MKPVRTTIMYGIVSALLVIPFITFQVFYWGWPLTHNGFLACILVFYSLLLVRWSRTDFIAIVFPLLLLAGLCIWPSHHSGFIFLALLLFAWIRSGICFNHPPIRAVIAEAVTLTGGFGFVIYWWSHSSLILSLAVWLFFLVQSLYFYIVPIPQTKTIESPSTDPFEQASREMKRMLDINFVR